MNSPTTRRDSERTREAFIAAGTDLFAQHGFDGATVEQIARKARVNKAMISYHFGGKEGLYRAILVATFDPVVEKLKALRGSSRPADEMLREFVGVFAEMVAGRPSMPAMILREVLSGGRHLDDEILPRFLSVFSTVREIVVRGMRDGTFRQVDPLMTHLGLIGSLAFFFATTPLRTRLIKEGKLPALAPSSDAFVRHVQEMVIRGLAAQTPGGRPGTLKEIS